MTPAQKTIQAVQERYAEHLIALSSQVKQVVTSDQVQTSDQGVLIPLELWEKLVNSANQVAA